ncbi:hypothetical protein CspHIS471_0103980 [Cutaneotrichosporon sp. HIS471]|nr:hypothetical protein CspHIS471_0103980 [Cutaneotrichosporon sp. HIS471]
MSASEGIVDSDTWNDGDFALISTDALSSEILYLFKLLDKYDCPAPHRISRTCVRGRPLSPLDKFTVGASVDDINICTEALNPFADEVNAPAHAALSPRNMLFED